MLGGLAARQVGAVIGVALLGTLVAHPATIAFGPRVGVAIAGTVFLLGALATALAIPRGSPV